MNYYSREDADNLIKLEIAQYKRAIELVEQLKPVVEKFDGKVFNKRFEDAIEKETCEAFSVGTTNTFTSYFEMKWYNGRDCVQSVEKDCYGYSSWNYLRSNALDLVGVPIRCNVKDVLNENKRINAKAMIEHLDKSAEYFRGKIEELTDGLNKVDAWVEKIRELKKQINELYHEVPSQFRDYYYEIGKDLKYW